MPRKSDAARLEELRRKEQELHERLKQTLGPELLAKTQQDLARVERHIAIIEHRKTKKRPVTRP